MNFAKALPTRVASVIVLAFLLLALGVQLLRLGGLSDQSAGVLQGTRTAVWLSLLTVAVSLPFGVVLGAVTGWWGRRSDALLARGVEVSGTLPILVVAGVVTSWSQEGGILQLAVCLGLLRGIELARVVRGEVRRLAGEDFVMAARALGASSARSLLRHVLPHCAGPIAVNVALTAAYAVGVEAMISFVGLRQPAGWISWGTLLGAAESAPMSAAVSALAALAFTGSLCVLAEAALETNDPRRPDRHFAHSRG